MPAAPTLYPTLLYRDAPAAIDWLEAALGFERHFVVDGPAGSDTIGHAELAFGGGLVMLGSASNNGVPGPPPGITSTYAFCEDPDGLHGRAVAHGGGEVAYAPRDTDYGSREFAIRDPEGHVWSFGTYRPVPGEPPPAPPTA